MQTIPQQTLDPHDPKRRETVLVTGGSGYIAGWIIVQLLAQGCCVRTTVRSRSRETAVRDAIATQVDAGNRLSFFVADLLNDEGWSDAVSGCNCVMHVASPMGQGEPKADLVRPAREGTIRVLKAARQAAVKRVVLTSSTVAAKGPLKPAQVAPAATNESTWTNPEEKGLGEYARSKTLAERAVWEFAEQTSGAMELVTILPGMVLGPIMTGTISGSVELISRMLTGKVPALPRVGFSVVDVRDLAALHIQAMRAPEAAGQRFLGVGDFLWMSEMAKLLRDNLGPQASKVPTRRLPDFVLRLAALFQYEARFMAPMLGQRTHFDVSKAATLLGWHPRPASDVVLACANDLIRQHLI